MWSILPKKDYIDFLNKYPNLNEFEEEDFLLYAAENHYILPRYFYRQFPFQPLYSHIDRAFIPKSIDFEFTSELRDYQLPVINRIKEIYNIKKYVNGVIKARPGFGKTVIAAYMSFMLKKKTLIIVDNNKIKEQWLDTYLKFTDLKEDDIGLIQGAKFELDKPIIIAMVQSLVSKIRKNMKDNYKLIKDAGIDLVFYDETHVTGSASKFALTSLLINTKSIIGLTATPHVQEMHKILLDSVVGPIIYDSGSYETVPEINFIKYRSKLSANEIKRISYVKDYIKKNAIYNSLIHTDRNYLNELYKIAKKAKENKHKTIIVAFTLNQVKAIINYFKMNNLKSTPFYSGKNKFDPETEDLLVATYSYSGKGFDWAGLSCLILACPLKGRTSLIQTSGRTLRQKSGKQNPVVYDLIDMNFFADTISTKKKVFKDEYKKCKINEVEV